MSSDSKFIFHMLMVVNGSVCSGTLYLLTYLILIEKFVIIDNLNYLNF